MGECIICDLPFGMSKQSIVETGAIQVDDATENLIGSPAAIKILYRPRQQYWSAVPNNEVNFYVVSNWKELKELLKWFIQHPEFIGG